MIKECPVIYQNKLVMVVKYDKEMIQLPSSGNEKSVYVDFENGKYTMVAKEDFLKNTSLSDRKCEPMVNKKSKKAGFEENKE